MSKTGSELIAEERQRQINKEGWTLEHDDQHQNFELVRAACAYLNSSNNNLIQQFWPWDWAWWKPSSHVEISGRIRDYVKAGALIAAEIDRMQRLSAHEEKK